MKSQVGIEFLAGVAILLIIYMISITAYGYYVQGSLVQDERGKQICYSVARAIDAAVIGENGFSMNVSIPYRIGSQDYFVIVSDKSLVTVDWTDGLFACSTISQNITDIFLYPCRFSLTNIDKVIYVSGLRTDKNTYSVGEDVDIDGGYYISDITIDIQKNGISESGYPQNLTVTDNSFSHTWNAPDDGLYKIMVQDQIYKNLNAEKDIEVI